MQRRFTGTPRTRTATRTTRIAAALGLLVAATAVAVLGGAGTASAATQVLTQTWANSTPPPTGSIGALNVSTGQANDLGGYPNIGVPWNGTVASGTGTNRVMSNLWGDHTSFTGHTTATGSISVNDQSGAFSVSNWDMNSYFPTGRPGTTGCTGPAADACHWTTENPHFPAGYPAIYKGCHYTQCSVATGAPFPMQLNSLVSLSSVWNTSIPNTGVFDVAYDIWLDRGVQAAMPAGAASIGQNDGAEIMLWVSNRGYAPNGISLNNPITPAGSKVATFTDSSGAVWDTWIGRQDPTGPHPWNIISYVRQTPISTFSIDTKQFLDDSLTYNKQARPGLGTALDICPAQNDGTVLGQCVAPSWWLTSVQAGFEIWNLAANGAGLGSTSFDVRPLTVLANPSQSPGGVTGKARSGNMPVIHWQDFFDVKYAGCVGGGTGTAVVTPGNGGTPLTINLTETPAASGIYAGTNTSVLNPGHDGSTLAVTIPGCPGGSQTTGAIPVFIDPSGYVQTTAGNPIQGATVQLQFSSTGTAAGPWVAPASTLILPTTNPELTDAAGHFRWDVQPGLYRLQVSATGCTSVTSDPLPVPPPQVDLLIRLSCSATAPGVVLPKIVPPVLPTLPVVVTVRAPGVTPFGYCADFVVTNNTAAATEWSTTFTVPGNYRINQAWNNVYTQVGNQATNVHADPSNPWNKILQPGQSTTSTGFCAVP